MFYKVNSTKVSIKEYLYEGGPLIKPLVLMVALVVKLFRIRIPGSIDIPPVDRLSPFLVTREEIDGDVDAAFEKERQWLESARFNPCGDIYINDTTSNTRYGAAVFISPDSTTIAWARARSWPSLSAKGRAAKVQFTSVSESGTVVVTTSANRDLLGPPDWLMEYRTGELPQNLFSLHRERLSEVLRAQRIRSFFTPEEAIAQLDALQKAFADFQESRGVFEPLTLVSPTKQAVHSLAEVRPYADELVIAEVRKQETKQTQLLTKLLLLGVSLAVFLGIGAAQWDWKIVLMLVPILFIHELGHLVAMKVFGYKNINMFYIPFFGAAVTGRHYNVEGWRKVLVSLAGPVPSIAIAIVMGGIGFACGWKTICDASLFMMIINLFNLLPFLPLDGGWVAHITLFSRSRYLDIAFRVLTIIVMLAGTIIFDDRILMFLGIAMAIGLPSVWKTLRVQDELAGAELPLSTGNQIPDDAIQQISRACQKARLPANNAKQLAATTIRVYEAVSMNPPSWPATFGLWGLYAMSVMVGLVGILAYVTANVFQDAMDVNVTYQEVEHALSLDDAEFRLGTGRLPQGDLLMWRMDDSDGAARSFESLSETSELSVARFGNVVLSSAISNDLETPNGFAFDFRSERDIERLRRSDSRLSSQSLVGRIAESRSFGGQDLGMPNIVVTFADTESISRVKRLLIPPPNIETEKKLLAPWSPYEKPTADQLRLRQLLATLTGSVDELPWAPVDPPAIDESAISPISQLTPAQQEEFLAKNRQANLDWQAATAKAKMDWIQKGLARSTGDTKNLIEAYLRYDSDQANATAKIMESAKTLKAAQDGTELIKAYAEVPKLGPYLADSMDALGYIDPATREYRFAATAYSADGAGSDWESDDENPLTTVDDTAGDRKLTIYLSEPVDACAAYSGMIAWLKSYQVIDVKLVYSKVEMPEDE